MGGHSAGPQRRLPGVSGRRVRAPTRWPRPRGPRPSSRGARPQELRGLHGEPQTDPRGVRALGPQPWGPPRVSLRAPPRERTWGASAEGDGGGATESGPQAEGLGGSEEQRRGRRGQRSRQRRGDGALEPRSPRARPPPVGARARAAPAGAPVPPNRALGLGRARCGDGRDGPGSGPRVGVAVLAPARPRAAPREPLAVPALGAGSAGARAGWARGRGAGASGRGSRGCAARAAPPPPERLPRGAVRSPPAALPPHLRELSVSLAGTSVDAQRLPRGSPREREAWSILETSCGSSPLTPIYILACFCFFCKFVSNLFRPRSHKSEVVEPGFRCRPPTILGTVIPKAP